MKNKIITSSIETFTFRKEILRTKGDWNGNITEQWTEYEDVTGKTFVTNDIEPCTPLIPSTRTILAEDRDYEVFASTETLNSIRMSVKETTGVDIGIIHYSTNDIQINNIGLEHNVQVDDGTLIINDNVYIPSKMTCIGYSIGYNECHKFVIGINNKNKVMLVKIHNNLVPVFEMLATTTEEKYLVDIINENIIIQPQEKEEDKSDEVKIVSRHKSFGI